MGYLKRLKTSGSVSLEAFKMYYVMRASAPSLHRESVDSLFQYLTTKYTQTNKTSSLEPIL